MTDAVAFNAELVRKYDGAGPRYTSYPTAPQFGESFGEAQLREHARRSNESPIPRTLSLYLHIPYCFSPCFYCGCNRIVTSDRSRGDRYLERLLREIELVAPLFDPAREVIQLHLGGGTPNFLRPGQLRRLIQQVGACFRFSAATGRDFSIEIDPRAAEPGDLEELAQLGLNRVSLGVQDFDPAVQRAVNRIQSIEQTLSVIEECRRAQFRSVNVDLIYGLPRQSPAGFAETLRTIIAARPDRLAIYAYAHLPEMFKAQRQIRRADLPDPATKLGLLQLAIDSLSAAGYVYIGMDHFARAQDDLACAQRAGDLHRNFMGYTTHADSDLVAMGVSAISHVGSSFSQNRRALPDWERAIDAGRLPVWRGIELDRDDLVRAEVIQRIMCQAQIDIGAIERRHEIDFWEYFSDARAQLEQLRQDGLITLDSRRVVATAQGRLLLRSIAMCFDRYLQQSRRDRLPGRAAS